MLQHFISICKQDSSADPKDKERGFCLFVCLGEEDWEIEINISLDFEYTDPKLLNFCLHEKKNCDKNREAQTCS